MLFKKSLDLGIIIGEQYEGLLSFDDYVDHMLLPYSPRFRNIDFSVSSLSSVGIRNIIVFATKDSQILLRYLSQSWPLINFYVFDYIDAREKFNLFFSEYLKDNKTELIVIIKGSYPVWLNLKDYREHLEKSNNLAIKTRLADREVYSSMVTDRKTFLKKYVDLILEFAKNRFDIEKLSDEFNMEVMDTKGYIMPLSSLEQFYNLHIDMLDDYLVLDRFNAVVPIKGDMATTVYSTLGKDSHFINSIFGEEVDINGKVENSVIFSGVKIQKNAYIKNSVIFPGNHIGSHSVIVNTIIDEFSGDNTNPNIEHHCSIGNETPTVVNEHYPNHLNFGVTLIGKDAYLPAHTTIGSNCYIDSFCGQLLMRFHKVVKDGESVFRK